MIVRTIDEIKAYYEELREAFKRNDSGDDDWVGEPIKEKWLLFDRISELEARCAELERDSAALDGWRSVEESPPMAYDDDEAVKWRFEVSEEVGAVVKMNVRKHQWFFPDGRKRHIWFSNRHNIPIEPEQVIGWQPLPPAPRPSPDEP